MTVSKNLTKDWNENDWERFRHWIHILLKERPVKITFTKKRWY